VLRTGIWGRPRDTPPPQSGCGEKVADPSRSQAGKVSSP
jgi:hypothetical protein